MDAKTAFFYLFAVVLLVASFRVVTARNPVHAVLNLILAFSQAAAIWLLLKAEFLAIALVLVYLGAVMVLFLFVVMMLDINIDRMREGFWGYLPLSVTVGVIIVLEMAAVLWHGFRNFSPSIAPANINLGGTKELGLLIYTQYVFAFEIAAVVLLVAIVAAVALTLRKRKDTKHFAPGDAVRVKRNDRLKIIKMDPVVERPAAPEVKETP